MPDKLTKQDQQVVKDEAAAEKLSKEEKARLDKEAAKARQEDDPKEK